MEWLEGRLLRTLELEHRLVVGSRETGRNHHTVAGTAAVVGSPGHLGSRQLADVVVHRRRTAVVVVASSRMVRQLRTARRLRYNVSVLEKNVK